MCFEGIYHAKILLKQIKYCSTIYRVCDCLISKKFIILHIFALTIIVRQRSPIFSIWAILVMYFF